MQRHMDVRALLRRLDGASADDLESETIEFKPWDSAPEATKKQLRDLREAVVCLSNARGGTLIVGVADRKRSRAEAIHGVENLERETLRREVYRGTAPPILVDVSELDEPEGRVLVIHVPKGLPPHTTTEGVGKIRVGKECRPITGPDLSRLLLARGGVDLSGEVLEDATFEDLDPEQIRRVRRSLAEEGQKPDLARRSDHELLESLGVLRDGGVTLAAILLVGRSRAISRFAPFHEVTFARRVTATRYDFRRDWRGPLLEVLDALRAGLEANLRVETIATDELRELSIPQVTWLAAREAVLNGLVHRDYFQQASVAIELFKDRIEVSSPGGFIGGVTPENVLRHAPVRRNSALAEAFQAIGFVNRRGLGVDRIYEELLRLGKGMPRYDADEASVRLVLPTRTHEEFARFVAEELRAGRMLDLDDLILLRTAVDYGVVDRWTASKSLQLREDEAAERLVAMRERGFFCPHGRGRGTAYTLTRALSDRLRGKGRTDDDLSLDAESVRLRVVAVLRERRRITNRELRRLSGWSRPAVGRLMNNLREARLAELAGRGRGAAWVAGPELPPAAPKEERRK